MFCLCVFTEDESVSLPVDFDGCLDVFIWLVVFFLRESKLGKIFKQTEVLNIPSFVFFILFSSSVDTTFFSALGTDLCV